jgi:hypothetical protein
MDHFFDAMFNPNNRLSGPAIEALKYFKNQYTYRQMIEDRMNELSADEKKSAIIKRNLF